MYPWQKYQGCVKRSKNVEMYYYCNSFVLQGIRADTSDRTADFTCEETFDNFGGADPEARQRTV